jgi:hypothetical protein
MMQSTAEVSERQVCAILAAQVAALRDQPEAGASVELLWQTSDVLSRLSNLVNELLQRPGADAGLAEQCAAALAAEAELRRTLDGLAFQQAQRQDLARQVADCVVTALHRLAAVDEPITARFGPRQLSALYVSEHQREVHEAVVRELGSETSPEQNIVTGFREGAGN